MPQMQSARYARIEEHDTGKSQPELDKTPLAPPPGTRAARLARFQREHPALYASRHVALAILKVTLPLLGIGAVIVGLLPQIDWSWLADIGAFVRPLLAQIRAWVPDIDPPFAVPREWIVRHVKPVVGWAKWVLPIIIAMLVAIEEVRRHRRKQQHGAESAKSREDTRSF